MSGNIDPQQLREATLEALKARWPNAQVATIEPGVLLQWFYPDGTRGQGGTGYTVATRVGPLESVVEQVVKQASSVAVDPLIIGMYRNHVFVTDELAVVTIIIAERSTPC